MINVETKAAKSLRDEVLQKTVVEVNVTYPNERGQGVLIPFQGHSSQYQ